MYVAGYTCISGLLDRFGYANHTQLLALTKELR